MRCVSDAGVQAVACLHEAVDNTGDVLSVFGNRLFDTVLWRGELGLPAPSGHLRGVKLACSGCIRPRMTEDE